MPVTIERSKRALSCALLLSAAAMAAPTAALSAQSAQPAVPVMLVATGGLRTGDRILLRVDGERQWTDTFTVRAGPEIDLPTIGVIRLLGVRREDVQPYLTREFARYMKNPIVHATALVRVGVLGEVAHPGFYEVPADALLADAITAAGGPTREASVPSLHIDRDGKVVQKGKALHTALDRGATLNQLGMQAGDEIIVPRAHDAERTARIVSLVIGVPLAIFGLTRLH